jgi:RNA-directed DNA polymerase
VSNRHFQKSTPATDRSTVPALRLFSLFAVKGDANPYDPAYEIYFEQREGTHMQETFRGTRTLRFLWHEQRGICTVCNTKITRITGWRLHHCVPRVMGGSQSAENRVLLHPECHDRVHRQRIPVSKPRLPERGVRRA